MTEAHMMKSATRRPRKMAREAQVDAGAAPTKVTPALNPADVTAKRQTKAAQVEAMLAQAEGATLDDLCRATGWLPHTCRAFLTGLRKKGKAVERSRREDGATSYKLGAGVSSAGAEAAVAPAAAA